SPPVLSTLSLHDALPISSVSGIKSVHRRKLKTPVPPSTTSGKLFLKSRQCCRQNLANDAQAFGINSVEPVFCRVPIGDREIDERSEEHTSELLSLRHLVC